jgi:hypothetical protein
MNFVTYSRNREIRFNFILLLVTIVICQNFIITKTLSGQGEML